MFVRKIVDPSEDRHVRIHFVFGCEVHEGIILNVEIRPAEIQFLPCIHELCFRRRAKPLPPKIRSRNVNFIARAARQTRALQLRDVCGGSFLRVEIGVAGGKNEIGDRLRAQLSIIRILFKLAGLILPRFSFVSWPQPTEGPHNGARPVPRDRQP